MHTYWLELRPARPDATALDAATLESELVTAELVPLRAVRTDLGWRVAAQVNDPAQLDQLRFPEGWTLTSAEKELEAAQWQQPEGEAILEDRRLGDPYAFALLQWPAIVALFELANSGWQYWLKIGLAVWVGLMALTAYAGKRPGHITFGNAMLLAGGCVAGFWWFHPSPWMYGFLFFLLMLFYSAQRALWLPHASHHR